MNIRKLCLFSKHLNRFSQFNIYRSLNNSSFLFSSGENDGSNNNNGVHDNKGSDCLNPIIPAKRKPLRRPMPRNKNGYETSKLISMMVNEYNNEEPNEKSSKDNSPNDNDQNSSNKLIQTTANSEISNTDLVHLPSYVSQNESQHRNNIENSIDDVPLVPLKYPVFPWFHKLVEITDQVLAQYIREKINQNQPYVGTFVTKNAKEIGVVTDLNQIFNVGILAHVKGVREVPGNKLSLLISGIKRIQSNEVSNNEKNEVSKTIEVTNNQNKPSDASNQDKNVLMDKEVQSNDQTFANEFKLQETDKIQENLIIEEETNKESPSLINDSTLHMKKESILNIKIKEYIHEPYVSSKEIMALGGEIVKTLREIASISVLNFSQTVDRTVHSFGDMENPIYLADFGAAITRADPLKHQMIIEEKSITQRLYLTLTLLKEELAICQLQQQLGKKAEEQMAKLNRRAILIEQMRAIQQELGIGKDSRENPVDKYKSRLKNKILDPSVRKLIEEELERLASMDTHSSEHSTLSSYLDVVTSLPWGVYHIENKDLNRAKLILDEDHYGLVDVKQAILEFIAVTQQSNSVKGKILCFSGPPGVGKTSIAKSIAKALGREYMRFSVGGMDDVSEIKGHRRTYVGSMPGKIIQNLKRCKSMNPVLLIDEVDKMGHGTRGDPSSALLEVLDPEQNVNFMDHYVDLPIDLSKVLFICTANSLDRISAPLLDRMEIIELTGYIGEEKECIAKKYLIPNSVSECGLKENDVVLTNEALLELVNEYSREPGVRNLKKMMDKIHRKSSLKLQTGTNPPIIIKPESLYENVGNPMFHTERMFSKTPIGVATGLAYTSYGGKTLYIETIKVPGKNKNQAFSMTGRLGSVMKESTTLAHHVASEILSKIDPSNHTLIQNSVHCNFPEGATPKDGPSAGVTIVTALLSLALNIPVKSSLAMTGEICLSKLVLPVGGIKEKLIAAIRAGITHVILPEPNRRDINDISLSITSKIIISYATTYDDIFRLAFPNFVISKKNLVKSEQNDSSDSSVPDISKEVTTNSEAVTNHSLF